MQHDEESRYTNDNNNNYGENDEQSQYQPPPSRPQGSSKPPPAASQNNRRSDQPDQQSYCCSIANIFSSFIFPHENPGKSGTYKGFFLLMSGILVSIICLSYPDSFNVSADCPVGYEHSCQVANIVLRFSFALVCLVSFPQFTTVYVSIDESDSIYIKRLVFAEYDRHCYLYAFLRHVVDY